MSDHDQSPGAGGNAEEQPKAEHLNIKVTDNNNEVFFKIKRTTALSKLMNAFCERQGKNLNTVRFLFDGARVNPSDSPDSVSGYFYRAPPSAILSSYFLYQRDQPFGIYANMAEETQANVLVLLTSWRWPTAILSKSTRSRSEGERIKQNNTPVALSGLQIHTV